MFLIPFILMAISLIAMPAHGISIDKMILVARDKEANFFKLTNNTVAPMFITSSVTEQKISKEKVEEIPYTADNIDQWKINLSESQFVLMPDESKIVYVNENKCANSTACSRSQDDVFSIDFVPALYTPKGQQAPDSVGIVFGFSPSFILPASQQKVAYTYKIREGKETDYLVLDNTGNTMLTVIIDQCGQSGVDLKDCSTYRQVYADRAGQIPLPARYRKGDLKVKIVNGTETHVKDLVL